MTFYGGHIGRSVRRLAALATAAAVGLGVVTMTPAQADPAPTAVSPIADRTSTGVTADALPTVQIDGVVWSQAVVGNIVYAGGSFANARPAGAAAGTNLTPRTNLLAYNLTTGKLIDGFNPVLNGEVKTVTASPDGTRVYIGGQFTSVNGQNHYRIAAFDTATGALITSFSPGMDAEVNSITATNATVYVGGIFSMANGNPRARLAAFSAADGSLLGWAPTADAVVNAVQLTPDGSHVVVGGTFADLSGSQALGLGSVDAMTGAAVPFAVNKVVNDYGGKAAFTSLSTDGAAIYGTGYLYTGPGNFEGTFSADPDTGAINWLEDCHGDTYSAFGNAGQVYVVSHEHYCGNVGGFPETNPRTSHRTTAFTTNATGTLTYDAKVGYADFSGQPSPSLINWFPDLAAGTITGQDQAAWTVTGNSQYVVEGGEFPSVNGVAQQGLVRFAVPSIAPKKMGPADKTNVVTAAASSDTSASVSWPANWDPDNTTLTYRLYHTGASTPIYTVSQVSEFWSRPTLTYIDTGLSPGTTYGYRVVASDPDGNTLTTYSQSITTTGTPPTPPATTTTVTTSPSNPVVGQPVTATIAVRRTDNNAAASGAVSVSIDGGAAQTVTLTSGSAQVSTTFATSGNHMVSAAYTGNASFAASSATTTVPVLGAPTTTTVTTSPANPVPGQTVTADISVQRSDNNAAASGTVTVTFDGGTARTLTLSGGHAQLTTTFATSGPHTIAAAFAATTAYTASSATTTVTVQAAPTSTTITTTPSVPVVGSTATVTVAVQRTDTKAAASGTVSVKIDNGAAQTLPLTNGQAQVSTTFATAGAHTVSAAFGTTASLAASSATTTVTVAGVATATTITPSPANPVVGQAVTADITVQRTDTQAPASGSVSVTVDGGAARTLTLTSGHATLGTTFTTAGAHTVVASFGSTTTLAASSKSVTITVGKDATRTTAVVSPAKPVTGQKLSVRTTVATVAPGTAAATGSVTVAVDGKAQKPTTLTKSTATTALAGLPAGKHTIKVSYPGNATHAASTWSGTVTVAAGHAAARVASSTTTPKASTLIRFTAYLTAAAPATGTPTGSVAFYIDGHKRSTQTSKSGTAAYSVRLARGRHTIMVAYAGSTSYTKATSKTVTQTVG